jgi:hypothetical protein
MMVGVRCAWGVSGSENDSSDGKNDGKSYTGISEGNSSWVEAGTLTRLMVDLEGWLGEVIQIKIRIITASDDNQYFGSAHYEDGGAGFGGFYMDDLIVHGTSLHGG